jgi:probable phosphoglycerate mutase
VAALDGIRDAHQGEVVAVVSHADPIRLAVADYVGLPLDLYHRLWINPASVSVLDLTPLGPRLVCLNSTDELASMLLVERHTAAAAKPL